MNEHKPKLKEIDLSIFSREQLEMLILVQLRTIERVTSEEYQQEREYSKLFNERY